MTIRNNICDTVQLFLPAGTYNILKPMNFRPDADTFHRDYKHEKSILNYSRKNKEYFPQVSLSRMICGSHRSVGMIIRFSAPKILFGTNLCEICDTDFNALIATLKEKLTYLGIEIETNVLKKAEVVSIDFGKNILLPTGVACLSVIHEMGRWHPFSHLNCEKVNYRGNGSQVHYRSQKLDITVYDKTMESRSLLTTRKARDEAHHIAINPYMQKSSTQILRLEIRLSGKKNSSCFKEHLWRFNVFFVF